MQPQVERESVVSILQISFNFWEFHICLSDPGVPGVRSLGPDVRPSLTARGFADLTDVTLADEDSNSIPTDDVNRAFLGNVAMQVAPSDGQHWN